MAREIIGSIAFGLVVGSFSNVLIHRLPRKESIAWPGSKCPHCDAPIRWFQNIPVLSFLIQMGKCAACKAPISVRYPIVELLAAALFVAATRQYGWGWLTWLRDWPFLTLLLTVTFIDLDHRLIPDPLSLGGLILGLLSSYWVQGLGILQSVGGAALGFALFYGLAAYYERRHGKVGLGGGDIKFLAMIGAFQGPSGVLSTVLVSSIAGSVVGILYGLIQSRGRKGWDGILKVSIPYGPFLALGAMIDYFFGEALGWFRFTIQT